MLAGGGSGALPGSTTDSTVTVPSLAPTNRAHVSWLAGGGGAGVGELGTEEWARLARRWARSAATDTVPSTDPEAVALVDTTGAARRLPALHTGNAPARGSVCRS
jgi:hypothetical protein